MFGWFRKRREKDASPYKRPTEAVLRGGVDAMVAFLQANLDADDNDIVHHLTGRGLTEPQAIKLIQFVPIAFTRFLYRTCGVQFAPDYVLLGQDGQPKAQRPVADELAYREAWAHCEDAAVGGSGNEYFVPIAARSGGYRALQDLVSKGSNLSGIITSPPIMFEQ